MKPRMVLALAMCLSFVAWPAIGKRRPQAQTAAAYPNSTAGLEQLVWDMVGAQKGGGEQGLAPYLQALALPDSASWFADVFGADNGRQLAVFYDAWSDARNAQISGDLARAVAAQMTDVTAFQFEKAGDPGTTNKDDYFLSLRQHREPLYAVVFKGENGAGMRWTYFVYEGGTFRYLGPLADLRLVAGSAAAQPAEKSGDANTEENSGMALSKRVHIDGTIMQSHLTHRVEPAYPPDALKNRVEGAVALHLVVAPDGSVQTADAVEGNPVFVPSAIAAVRQWRFQPILLNGSPVMVETTITVNFHLTGQVAVAGQPGAAARSASIPSYSESSGGLTKMMKEILDLAKRGDNAGLTTYYNALILPNPDSWFASQFGAADATSFAQNYANMPQFMPEIFTSALEPGAGMKFDHVEVYRFKDACDSRAGESEYPILAAREQQSTPLYEVRFVKDTTYRLLFPFAYVDGGFRYLGNLTIIAPKNQIAVEPSPDGSRPDIQYPKVIHQVPPVYPSGFDQRRNNGLVKLWGVIGIDGTVSNLHVIEGTCAFAKATIDAYKKWRYTPLMVNGKAQEMYYPFQFGYTPGQ
ncbi:MAG: energy transducer TonB [Candidatus Acidiferrales bacterium]